MFVFTNIFAAFMFGFVGSLHCAGMCGPLALSLPVGNYSIAGKAWAIFKYNLGRAITYAALGIFSGLIITAINVFKWQQVISIVSGILILILYFKPFKKYTFLENNILQKKTNRLIQKVYSYKKYFLLFGLANGLLPCGLVFMALAASVSSQNFTNAVLFMFFFGIGTFPLMMSIPLFGHAVIDTFRSKLKFAVPLFVVLISASLIVRGLGLGIPYVSPKINNDNTTLQNKEIHCSPTVK